MITSKECWMKPRCKKGLDPNSSCNTCDEFCVKLYKTQKLYEAALISPATYPHMKLRIDADGSDREAFHTLKSIENNILAFVSGGANLYMYSETCGNGKTSWAIRLLKTYLDRIWLKSELSVKALYIHVPQFLLALRDNISQYSEYANYILDNIDKAEVVVWDDIATKTFTEFERERLLALIDDRLHRNKSNIFTSNLSPRDLDIYTGSRIFSRVINTSTCVQFTGRDKRGLH